MKVKFLRNAYEKGMNYKIGEIAEIEDERAKVLEKTGIVQILSVPKAVEKPPKDKMVHSKRVHRK